MNRKIFGSNSLTVIAIYSQTDFRRATRVEFRMRLDQNIRFQEDSTDRYSVN